MEIKTKFNTGDNVFIFIDGRIKQFIVSGINIDVVQPNRWDDRKVINENYFITQYKYQETPILVRADRVYDTMDDLCEALKDEATLL